MDEHLKKLDLKMTDLDAVFKAVISRLEGKLEATDQTLQVFGHRQEKIEDTVLDMNQKYEKMMVMIAQITSDLKAKQKNKGVEGSLSSQGSGSGLTLQLPRDG